MSEKRAVSIQFGEYVDADLPDFIRIQVLSFLRIVWPEGFTGPNRFRDWTSRSDLAPYHLIYAGGSQLVSHVEIVTTTVTVNKTPYLVKSPTAVLTFPTFRGEGWAGRLIAAAVSHIDSSGADVGVLTCAPRLIDFYTRLGWTLAGGTAIMAGPDGATWTSADVLLTRSTGPRSDNFLRDIQSHPMRVADEW